VKILPRKNVYISEKAIQAWVQLANQADMSASAFIERLLLDTAAKKNENIAAMREEMERFRFAENANGKNITAMLEMLNTYFKTFANGEPYESAFFPIDDQPHPWTRKSLEVAESKIRMAKYAKLKGGD
jgi:hypothetical protein